MMGLMGKQTADKLGEGVVYEDRLPLGWDVSGAPAIEAGSVGEDEHNEKLLSIIASLEALPAESDEGPAADSTELARLDFKLNLLMDLVTQLLSRTTPLPAYRDVSFGARVLSWHLAADEAAPASGERLRISLYLHPEYPKPLILNGHVVAVTDEAEQQAVDVALDGLSETAQDLLEKLIFRHHRRQVAQRRSAADLS